jgi:hypothetical protein
MKRKKKVTAAVLAANRANAQSSTGPKSERTKSTTAHNTQRHGILTRKVVLNEVEEKEYRRVRRAWKEYFHPRGELERFLVEEVTQTSWKLGITEGLETAELSRRQDVRDEIDGVFHGQIKLPVSDWDLPVDRGWDCERIVVRALAGNDEKNSNTWRGPAVVQNQVVPAIEKSYDSHKREGGHLEVQAVLGSSLATMTRYRSALKRDFYSAIDRLRVAQAERRENEKQRTKYLIA